MCKKSVQRYIDLFNSTGSVAPAKHTNGPQRLLTEFEQLTVVQSVLHQPGIYLHEVQSQLFSATGKCVHVSTICRTLSRLGLTRQKMQIIALQQSEELRLKFMAEISAFDPNMLLWIDETGSDRRNCIRQYGYSLRGVTPVSHKLRVGGKRISAIPILSTEGIEDVYTTTDSVNGDKFEDFICQCLLPIIQPFDGKNTRSVVLMDNASIHHCERVEEIITSVGARLHFLPPYNPDLMPLEEVFAKVKRCLTEHDTLYKVTSSPETLVKIAFSTVTCQDCTNYIKHAGYL